MRDGRFTGWTVPSGRRIALGLGAALLVLVGLGVLVARAAGFDEIRDAIASADARWFAACISAQLLALVGYTAAFREAFRWRGGVDPGFRLSARVMLASIGATRVVVAGGAGALAATYWCFRRAGFPTEAALTRVLGFNALFYVSFGVGAWAAALATVLGAGDASAALTVPWLVAIPLCFAAATFVTRPSRVGALAPAEASLARRALGFGIAALAWVREVLPKRAGCRSLVASTAYWLGNVACLWAALASVGISLPPAELLLAFATGHAASIVPLPLGGVGGVDAAMTYALTVVGVSLAPALIAVAVYRAFAFWAPTAPALAALVVLPRTGRALARAALVAA